MGQCRDECVRGSVDVFKDIWGGCVEYMCGIDLGVRRLGGCVEYMRGTDLGVRRLGGCVEYMCGIDLGVRRLGGCVEYMCGMYGFFILCFNFPICFKKLFANRFFRCKTLPHCLSKTKNMSYTFVLVFLMYETHVLQVAAKMFSFIPPSPPTPYPSSPPKNGSKPSPMYKPWLNIQQHDFKYLLRNLA